MSTPNEIPFQELLDALLDENTPLHPRYLYRLADLSETDLARLEQTWPRVSTWRRRALMEDVEELGESDYLLSFEALARLAVEDPDSKVRMHSVHILWEYEEDDLIDLFLDLLSTDEDPLVRAAAATGLGTYVYLGEIEELDQQDLVNIENSLLRVANSTEAPIVRRRALESLGFSSRPEVPPLIEAAYSSQESDWLVSALFAMGRSADDRWRPAVMDMVDHPNSTVRAESVRAAGELEIAEAGPLLLDMLEDEDEDVRSAAIWSLSQLGGEGVRDALEILQEESEDDEEIDYIESALDNLSFTEEMQLYSLIDLPDDEIDTLDEDEDLSISEDFEPTEDEDLDIDEDE
ncbi:MAG: HEAT repeat domain-containing protein [Omnitrophica WOR_2 bacterium]